jgi:hypothetical protein
MSPSAKSSNQPGRAWPVHDRPRSYLLLRLESRVDRDTDAGFGAADGAPQDALTLKPSLSALLAG